MRLNCICTLNTKSELKMTNTFAKMIFIGYIYVIFGNIKDISLVQAYPYDPEDSCMENAKKCAERRYDGKETMLMVFRDIILYYCLDLFKCSEGKEIICHKVRRIASEYIEPSQRRRLMEQCNTWNITIQYDDTAPLPPHKIRPYKRIGHKK